jgi:hypothetical protein
MATAVGRKAVNSIRNTPCGRVLVDMPQSDIVFFQLLADKMGWVITDNKQSLWDDYIKTCPKDVPLTDENILEAVREVRYGKV